MARPTVARIDLDALIHNVRSVRGLVGARKICAAVKADAYGHGAPVVCHAMGLAGVTMFAVAMTEEAVELREAGISRPIMLLTPAPLEDMDAILDYDVAACVTDEGFARELSAQARQRGKLAQVHVKVDTGMHRLGLDWQTAATHILSISELKGLSIAGIFSHFACSDADDLDFSREQVRRFKSVLGQLRCAGMDVPFAHMANSNGVMRLPEAYFDGVRPGLMLHGLCSRPELHGVVDLRPVMSLSTRISHLRSLPEGEKIGYGHTFTTWRETLIATLPIGYHDGFIRQFSNVGELLVRGRRAAVVGRVCMDQTLVDVTEVPEVQVGDEAVIYGPQGADCITVEEMARRVDRIPYELTCAVSRRVRRQFVLDGKVIAESPWRPAVPEADLSRAFTALAVSHEELPAKSVRRGAA
jgi:alanine racemase